MSCVVWRDERGRFRGCTYLFYVLLITEETQPVPTLGVLLLRHKVLLDLVALQGDS
jgi:hypothetical protein